MEKIMTEMNPRMDQDSAWKDILDIYFREFMEFFYPQFAAKIDWSCGFEMLDKELQSITPGAVVTRRSVDKLFKVFSLNGQEQWVLFHLEIQGDKKDDFEQRLFEYYYRLYERYRLPVVTLAILTDDNKQWRPENYRTSIWGKPIIEFNFFMVKLLDFSGQADELAKQKNPFGLIVQAHLEAEQTRKDPESRYRKKLALTHCLYDRGFSREQILTLYKFFDWVMTLPDHLEIRYNNTIHAIEQERSMSYITSAERIGIQKGEANLLLRQLQRKFSHVPEDYQKLITGADADRLLIWGERLMDATTLEAIFMDSSLN